MKAPAPATEGTVLFLTGWPACGIAELGAWLAEHRGHRHLDLDDDSGRDRELREAWAALLPDSAPRLIRELRAHAKRWVITGERPADHLPYLGALSAAGVGLWFLQPQLDGHSRQHWLARERLLNAEARAGAWDKLADAIRRNARELRPHFRNRCIPTLAVDGPIPFEAIAAAMHIPAPGAGVAT
jgi:hypothetical protein